MIVVNTEFVPGREVRESLGLVRGSTIRAKHIGKDLLAGLRTLVGGKTLILLGSRGREDWLSAVYGKNHLNLQGLDPAARLILAEKVNFPVSGYLNIKCDWS